MQALDPISISSSSPANVDFTSDVIGVLLYNESNYALQVDMQGYTRWVSAWTLDYVPFQSMLRTSGTFKITAVNISSNSNPPSSDILITLVKQGDTVSGTYPAGLTRQVASQVTSSSSYTLLAPDNAAEVFLDDTSFAANATIIPSQVPPANAALDIRLAAKLNSSTDESVLHSDVANNAVHMDMALILKLATGQSLSGVQVLSGTGPGTVSHSLGVTPAIAIITPTNAQVSWSVSNYGATTVTVNIANGDSWKLFLLV